MEIKGLYYKVVKMPPWQSVCLSIKAPQLLTQTGTWQVIVSQAEEVILFWDREDMQNMFLLYSPEHHVLILQVWNRVTNVLSFSFSFSSP